MFRIEKYVQGEHSMRFSLLLKLTALGVATSLIGCGSPDDAAPSSTVDEQIVADAVYFGG